ncbi:MAG: PKD domain-containing protein [Candidatus Latescibacterota bacterium]
MVRLLPAVMLLLAVFLSPAQALERPDMEFKIFQFPPNMIPTIDGKTDDWKIVGNEYVIGSNQLSDTVRGIGTNIDPKDFSCTVKVGWVKGINRLYFLYEAYDDFWKFDTIDLCNDIFEVVVDGDLSGGPLIKSSNPNKDRVPVTDLHFMFHGVHAQNYHIFTPAEGKDWNMVWGCPQYTKDLPFANYAYNYNFKNGQDGKLILEFWITPFDYAPYDAPERAIESKLEENKIIGLSWSVLDYDKGNDKEMTYSAFMNLSHKTTMYGDASDLVAFRLMPLEKRFRKPLEINWTFTVADMDRRVVAFKDLTYGRVTTWKWDFGDGATSAEQNPVHQYKKPGEYVVVLFVEGPDGKGQFSRVWDVTLR